MRKALTSPVEKKRQALKRKLAIVRRWIDVEKTELVNVGEFAADVGVRCSHLRSWIVKYRPGMLRADARKSRKRGVWE